MFHVHTWIAFGLAGALASCGMLLEGEDGDGDGTGLPPRDEDGADVSVPVHVDAGDAPDARRFFLTHLTYPGDLGGLDGGDEKCMREAAMNGLPGAYVAYLHAGGGDPGHPRYRLDAGPPWMRVDGKIVFASYPVDREAPLVPPSITADGGEVDASARAWVGVYTGPTTLCDGWTSQFPSGFPNAPTGRPTATNATWQNANDLLQCSARAHLYCFER